MAFTAVKTILIDKGKVSGTLSDFPFCFSGTFSYLKTTGNGGSVTNSNGYDICFYSDRNLTTPLYWETERYISTTGEVIFWIKIPSLSSTADTYIYMAYGDSGISTFQSTVSSVWDSNFKSVYHLPNGTTLSANDSTSNASNGTLVNTPTATTGQVAGGGNFVGASNQYVNLGAQNIGTSYTVSMWVKPSGNGTILIADRDGTYVGNQVNIILGSSYIITVYIKNTTISTSAVLTASVWNKVDVTYTSNTVNVWINGVKGPNQTLAQTPAYNAAVPFWLASQNVGGSPNSSYTGVLDEIRLSNVVRSDDWLKAEYSNQTSSKGWYYILDDILSSNVPSIFVTKPLTGNTNIVDWSNPITKGLVGAFRCREGAGKMCFDATRFTPPGTLTNDAVYNKSIIGSGILFDGTADYVTFGNGIFKGFNNATQVTVSVICEPKGFAALLNGIVGRWNGTVPDAPWELCLYTNAGSTKPLFIIYNQTNYTSGNLQLISNITLSLGVKYHITVIWIASTNTMKICVNGVIDSAVGVVTGTPPTIILADAATSMRISTFQESGGPNNYAFNGNVNNVLLWNRAVTETEMRQLFLDQNNIYI